MPGRGAEGPKRSMPAYRKNKANAVKNSTNPKRRITTPAQVQKKKRGK